MKLRHLLLILTLWLCATAISHAAPNDAADRAALLKDVHSLVVPGGIPGDLVVFGDHAFTLVTGRMGRANLPVFAAARFGTGRVVLGGHEGFFGDAALKGGDNAVFARNIAAWAAARDLPSARVELIGQSPALRDALAAAGCSAHVGRASELPDSLKRADLLWIDQATLDGDEARIASVRDWVSRRNGGLVILGPAWGWQSINSTKDLAKDHSGNQIVMPMGLAFAGGTLNGRRGAGYIADPELLANTGANEALSALEAQSAGTRSLTAADLSQITAVLGEAMGSVPANYGGFAGRVTALCADRGSAIPTKATPITAAMPFARLKAVLDMQRMRNLPAEQVKAYASAAEFPGSVPADAKRETRTVHIDSRVPMWHGVGLYAPAGEVIRISLPPEVAGKGFGVRIGEHTDTLWNLDKWERFPEVSITRPLSASITKVASSFGGTIFIEVPERSGAGVVNITIAGAVSAPRYVRGETTREQWLNGIRSAPGPWAELQGRLVALSVPSSAVRDLDDPEALMAYWDEVMENCYSFFSAPKRGRPERYCVDVQIGAGYMHSGYPIMTGDDVAKTFCDLTVLRGSSGIKCWGFYHEMGHNFQRPEWTWASFGEVTNNLFSLYGTEKLNRAMVGAHPAMTAAEMEKRVDVVAAAPGAEPYYSKDPWYPLTMFWLMRHEFGWEPFTKLFAEFRDTPNSERPRTELQKHDQFLERFSRLTGRNLTKYLKAWGVDFSRESEEAAASLPEWMPESWN